MPFRISWSCRAREMLLIVLELIGSVIPCYLSKPMYCVFINSKRVFFLRVFLLLLLLLVLFCFCFFCCPFLFASWWGGKVEEDNVDALAFYGGVGFDTLFVDRAARRYDTSGFLLQNVRTSKLTMRKVRSGGHAAVSAFTKTPHSVRFSPFWVSCLLLLCFCRVLLFAIAAARPFFWVSHRPLRVFCETHDVTLFCLFFICLFFLAYVCFAFMSISCDTRIR